MAGTDASGGDAAGRSQRGDPAAADGPSFADVLNGLIPAGPGRGSWWSRRPAQAARVTPSERPREEPREPERADEWDEQEPVDDPLAVRPYARTGGRTRPVHDLPVEALVVTTDAGRGGTATSVEHAAIARLCEEVRSVAEVSALLAVPLGVARVLVSDMVDAGLVVVRRTPSGEDGYPDLPMLERVLEGLRNL